MAGAPAEDTGEFFVAGYEDGGVARAAGTEFAGNFLAGDALCALDDIENGVAASRAHVEGFAGHALDFFEGADVGIGDIQDMDVVAKAGAVGSGVVGAEDVDVRENAG